MKKKLLICAALLAAGLLYGGYVRYWPNPAAEFLRREDLADQSVWLRVDAPEGLWESELLDSARRETLAAVLRETEVRRYALWEPWDTSENAGVFITLYFHDGTNSTVLTLCPPGRFVRFRGAEERYFVPRAEAICQVLPQLGPFRLLERPTPENGEKVPIIEQ